MQFQNSERIYREVLEEREDRIACGRKIAPLSLQFSSMAFMLFTVQNLITG